MYTCPACKQSLSSNEGACDWCAVKLAPDAQGAPTVVLPNIKPGKTIASKNFSYEALPSMSHVTFEWKNGDVVERHHDGAVFRVADGYRWFTEPYFRMRDGVVRTTFDVLDPGVRVRVLARLQTIGAVWVWYDLSLYAETQSVRLSRCFTSSDKSDSSELFTTSKHHAIRGLDMTNQLELRLQGPTLEAWVNGVKLCALHDDAFGIGSVAIGAGSNEKNRRAVRFRSMDVLEVAP